MSSTGRFAPSPEHYGGGPSLIATILTSLNAQRGTAYDTSTDASTVYAENEAIARMLAIAWEQNQRFANQFDPRRMTDFIPRWERIFGITPLTTATKGERRAEIAERFARIGVVPHRQELVDRLTTKLGAILVAYETTILGSALQWWPGGTPNADAPWYSTTAKIRVRVAKPSSMTLGAFIDRVAAVAKTLDPLVPAWVTFDWYAKSASGLDGFFLDEDLNLDFQAFD